MYTCLDALLGRPVALKVFARPAGPEVEALFQAEARQRGWGW